MEQCVAECKNRNSYSFTLSYIFSSLCSRDCLKLFKCQGWGAKNREGHMNIHVVSRGSPLTLASQQG